MSSKTADGPGPGRTAKAIHQRLKWRIIAVRVFRLVVWFTVCAKAKGNDLDHRQAVTEDREESEYSFDSCFSVIIGVNLTFFVGSE